MTEGYLWTGQYEECKSVIENGKGQSMELDEENLDGHWATDSKTNMDFFIINDAIFSKLCILGDDVEPCFEGASITAPQVSTSFTKMDENFKKTLYTMMQDLKFALKEGGKNMDMDIDNATEVTTEEEIVTENTEVVEETPTTTVEEETVTENAEEVSTENVVEEETTVEEKTEAPAEVEETVDKVSEEDNENTANEENQYSLLKEQFDELNTKYSNLEQEYNNLLSFKNKIDNEQKDKLIKSFYMLSDEDKQDVIENKEKYSLEDIEAKLSVICFRKKVNFDSENSSKNKDKVEDENIYTYNVNNTSDNASIPSWIRAVKDTKEKRN